MASSNAVGNAREFISPSDLTFSWGGCHRCLWLNYNHGLRTPGFMPLVGDLANMQEKYFENKTTADIAPVLPEGKVADLGGWVKSSYTQVLVAVYIRPQRTKSGIYLTDSTTDEDKYQSKVGLVLKKGPSAFVDDNNQWFQNVSVGIGDWIVHRPSDGWSITVNGVLCRILEDMSVKGKIDAPDRVW